MPDLAFSDGGLLPRDNRNFPALGGVDSDDQDGEVFPLLLDPVTGELLVQSSGSGTSDSNIVEIGGTAVAVNAGNADAGTLRVVIASDQPVLSIDDNAGSLTIDGTVTANAGSGTFTTNVSQVGGTAVSTSSGAFDAGTLRVVLATDQPVIPVSDNGGVLSIDDAGGSLTIDGTVTANAGTGTFDTNVLQIGGTAVSTGSGVLDAGTQRVVLATDQPAVSVDDNGATLSIDDGGGSLTVDGSFSLLGDASDLDTVGTDLHDTVAIGLPASGGHVIGGTSTNPFRTDPTGTTTQPVSDAGGSLTIDGTVTANAGTGNFATNTTQIGGTAVSTGSGVLDAGTQRVVLATDQPVISIDDNAGSLTIDGTVTANAGTGTFATNLTQVGGTAVTTGSGVLGAGTLRVVLATDQPAVTVSGTVTANIGTPGTLALDSTLDLVKDNTETAQTASEPAVIVVGDTATLIFAASSTTRTVTMQNMGEATIFLGKSAVTATTGVAIKGGTVDNDAKGDTAVASHGDDIYGIVVTGTENLRIQVVSD